MPGRRCRQFRAIAALVAQTGTYTDRLEIRLMPATRLIASRRPGTRSSAW